MNVYEEKQIIGWVYLTAREELTNTQNCIEKMQMYWRQLQKKGIDNLEFEVVMETLIEFEKTLQRLLKKIKDRMSEGELLLLSREIQNEFCAPVMKERAEQLKYQIHENPHAGIFAWELAKDLIDFEEDLIRRFQRPW